MEIERVNLISFFIEHTSISTDDVMAVFNLDRKKLWYNIEKINESLKALNLETIQMSHKFIRVPESLVANKDKLINDLNYNYLVVPKTFRESFIFLYILLSSEPVSVNHLEYLLNVSRNTVLNTLKDIRNDHCGALIEIDYSREHGYQIVGEEDSIRELIQNSIHKISFLRYKEAYLNRLFEITKRTQLIYDVASKLNQMCKIYQIEFVSERYQEFIYLFTTILCKAPQSLVVSKEVVAHFQLHPMWQFTSELCDYFGLRDVSDVTFFTIRLLSAIQGGNEAFTTNESLMQITYAIIDNINELSYGALEIGSHSDLPKTLYQHLVPSYYRLRYNIPLSNPYTEIIKTEYADLFYLVERALEPLAKVSNSRIPKEEVAYFTVHFGGYLSSKKEKRKIRAITICPNGITSSLLLKIELQKIFNDIEIVLSLSSDTSLEGLDLDYDVIFSTEPIYSEKPVFVMKPMMNWVEREILIKQVVQEFGIGVANYDLKVSSFIEIIEKYTTIHDKETLLKELGALIFKDKRKKEENTLMDLLDLSLMQITDREMTWEEAIQVASEPLLKQGYIAQTYVDAMISKVKEIGPYIVLAPKVAIPHARPEDGAKKLGVSFMKSKTPIRFDVEGGEKNVNLVFVLSAVDNLSHLTALQELSYLLDDEDNIEAMIKEDDMDALLAFINQKSKEE